MVKKVIVKMIHLKKGPSRTKNISESAKTPVKTPKKAAKKTPKSTPNRSAKKRKTWKLVA